MTIQIALSLFPPGSSPIHMISTHNASINIILNGGWLVVSPQEINTGLSIAGSVGWGDQTYSNTLVLFSTYTLEILVRGN